VPNYPHLTKGVAQASSFASPGVTNPPIAHGGGSATPMSPNGGSSPPLYGQMGGSWATRQWGWFATFRLAKWGWPKGLRWLQPLLFGHKGIAEPSPWAMGWLITPILAEWPLPNGLCGGFSHPNFILFLFLFLFFYDILESISLKNPLVSHVGLCL
jgi:hypothetical protein